MKQATLWQKGKDPMAADNLIYTLLVILDHLHARLGHTRLARSVDMYSVLTPGGLSVAGCRSCTAALVMPGHHVPLESSNVQ